MLKSNLKKRPLGQKYPEGQIPALSCIPFRPTGFFDIEPFRQK